MKTEITQKYVNRQSKITPRQPKKTWKNWRTTEPLNRTILGSGAALFEEKMRVETEEKRRKGK